MTQTLTAILHQEGDLFVAECSETGTASQGATIQEAIALTSEKPLSFTLKSSP
jgi:predicted RNase H-like HicB family nuclease